MAKTSIYLPDDLAEQVRAYGIPVSEVAQAALRQAVRDAEIKENAMTDIQAVADRMKGIIAGQARKEQTKAERIRAVGAEWARQEADARELEYLAAYDGPPADFLLPTSMVFFGPGREVPGGPDDPYWPDFQAGAREVWEAVRPLLTEPGPGGES
jgi:post-segregation antitoxin (ccd killing protein)